jgi:hypothetical protein
MKMKKIFFPLLVLIININVSRACDFCNCYLGLNPHFKKNTVGIRYHFANYKGSHEEEAESQEMNMSADDFWENRTSVELHGQWYATPKLKILFSAPYVINSEGTKADHHDGDEEMSHGTERTEGLGDPLIIASHQLFNKTADSSGISQRLFAGGGIKLPFGKWKLEEGAEAHERIHQPGTGSWDFIASTEYLLKYKRVGLNVNASWLITSSNSQSFQFGNRFNANALCYYQVNVKDVSVYPNVGTFFEQASEDNDQDVMLQNSGGSILFAHAGMDFYFRNFSITTALQLPVQQTLNEPQPQMTYRFIAGISYAFN